MRRIEYLVLCIFNFQLKGAYYFFFVLLISFFLVLLMYLLFLIVFVKLESSYEILRCYECGFDPNSYTRVVFSYRFFLISILFIIFDVEISLILPVPFLIEIYLRLLIFFIFIIILLLGLFYEYYYGSLE